MGQKQFSILASRDKRGLAFVIRWLNYSFAIEDPLCVKVEQSETAEEALSYRFLCKICTPFTITLLLFYLPARSVAFSAVDNFNRWFAGIYSVVVYFEKSAVYYTACYHVSDFGLLMASNHLVTRLCEWYWQDLYEKTAPAEVLPAAEVKLWNSRRNSPYCARTDDKNIEWKNSRSKILS